MSVRGNDRLEDLRNFLNGFCFTVLHHVLPVASDRASHWDLLLEHPDLEPEKVLCFEVLTPPSMWSSPTKLVRLPNHRRIYLTYEGPISSDRGQVSLVLTGKLVWLPPLTGLLQAKILSLASKNENLSLIENWLDQTPMISLSQQSKDPVQLLDLNSAPGTNESWTLATTP